MKVFIWNYISQLTDRYHSDGGLVVIADNEQDARIEAMQLGVVFDDTEIPEVYELDNKHLGMENRIFIFPGAGRC